MDPLAFLGITLNSDGTVTRRSALPLSPASLIGERIDLPFSSTPNPVTVLSEDVVLNSSTLTSLRLFLPTPLPATKKLPLILDFHGGGFALFSASTLPFHVGCARLAAFLPAIVASVEYRLAPEHRLPAAFSDAADAIAFVRSLSDPWIADHFDPRRFFLMGSSAGATIALHAALNTDDPSDFSGIILNQPYFGGKERTGSELRLLDNKILPLPANDALWELALPIGADRDHEYCNVEVALQSKKEKATALPRLLVRGHGGDPLVDRQKLFVKIVRGLGVDVEMKLDEEGCHAAELYSPEKASALLEQVKEFVCGVPGGEIGNPKI